MNLITTDYFQNLFKASKEGDSKEIFDKVTNGITREKNEELLKSFTKEGIWIAVKDMALLKASGLDGFLVLFYQQYGSIVGHEVSSFCLAALR